MPGPISAPISNAPNSPFIDVITRNTAWTSATSDQQTPSSPWGSIAAPNPNATSRVSQHEDVGYFGLRKDLNIGLQQSIQFETPLQSNEQQKHEIITPQLPDPELENKMAKIILEEEEREEEVDAKINGQVVREVKREPPAQKSKTEEILQPAPKKEESLRPRPLREIQAEEERRKQEEKEKIAASNPTTVPPKAQKGPNSAWGGVNSSTVSSAPWAKDDEHVVHKTPSLREIQEMEARKAAERKAAERPNATNMATQGLVSSSKDDITSINTSWGNIIPNSSNASNSSSLSTSPVVTTPAWQSNNVTPKKTLREIQKEEEEAVKKRNKMRELQQQQALLNSNVGNTTVSSGMGKRYADTVVAGGVNVTGVKKPANPSTVPAWSNVASKSPAPRVAGQPLNLAATNSSSVSGVIKPNTSPKDASLVWDAEPYKGANGVQGVPRTQNQTGKQNDPKTLSRVVTGTAALSNGNNLISTLGQSTPRPPSEDFLKWCRNTLRPLTNINVDEFIQMLLTFPLDPPPNAIEIIQEAIYGNSTSLDGRRFADEFVKRRKADAAGTSMSSVSSYHTEGKLGKESVGSNIGLKEDSTNNNANAFKVVTTKKGKKKH